MSLIAELRRRNVLRVVAGYIVASWLVVQVVETIFPAFGFGDEAVRFVVVGLAVLFIPVVVAAWVFEWTPEGIRKDEGDEPQGPVVAAAARRWDRVVMVILAVAVAFFIVEKIARSPVDVEPALAVLPLVGAGLGPDQDYLSTSLGEGIHASLARIPGLVVSAWPTASALRSEGMAAPEVAARLKAPNYLDGSVRRSGDRIRINAQLVATASGKTVWSETFDGTMADVFEIQDEIADSVVANLKIGESEAPLSVQRTNPETYQLTAQAWSMINRVNQENNGAIAAGLLKKALALDPDYLSAINALAMAAFRQQQEGAISREEAGVIYKEVQERVLGLDPENGLANIALSWELFWEKQEVAHANLHLQIGLRTGLNDQEALRLLAGLARRTGHAEAAIWFSKRALAIDPTCENCAWQLGESLFYAGRIAEAIEAKERFQTLTSTGFYHYAVMLIMSGEPLAALDIVAARSGEPMPGVEAMAYHMLGDVERVKESIAILERSPGPGDQMELAQVYAFMGEIDLAFEALIRVAESDYTFEYQVFLPQWANLRDDPRWSDLRKRLGMSEERVSMLDFSPVLKFER